MLSARYRQALLALAAAAVLGLTAATPLQAQQERSFPTSSRALLATMRAVPAEGGGGVSCSNLNGYVTYVVSDGSSARPACVILVHPSPKKVVPGGLEALAERFMRAYKLSDYRIATAKDRSAAFLFREDESGSDSDWELMEALTGGDSLAPVINWLNRCCGTAPQRVEENKLVWRASVPAGGNRRDCEISLNLLRGMPCHVDIRLHNVTLPNVPEVLSRQLQLQLRPVSGNRGSMLRKRVGVKPLGYMEDVYGDGGIVLVRVAGESGLYRLGGVDALAAIREQRGKVVEPILPELPRVLWADEMAPAQGQPKSPAATQTPTAPEGDFGEEEDTPPAPGTPVAEPRASEPADLPPSPAMPTPAEARENYSRRLRAL